MAHGIDGIDHSVILVKDLDASRDLYTRLGFQMTPRGTHSPHMGTGNYLFILQRDYIELLGVLTPTPNNAEWRAKGEGLSAIALSTQNHLEAHATLKARGLNPLEPLEFSRPVEVPGGTRDAAFSVVRLPPDSVPGMSLFVCGHKTRELVWRPEWQKHPNTAQRIVSVTLPVADLDAAAQAWERPFGPGSASRDGAVVTIKTGGPQLIRLVPQGPATLTFGVASTAEATKVLQQSKVPHTASGNAVTVAPAYASGVQIIFTPS